MQQFRYCLGNCLLIVCKFALATLNFLQLLVNMCIKVAKTLSEFNLDQNIRGGKEWLSGGRGGLQWG